MKPKENSIPSPHPRHLFLEWYHSASPGQTLQKTEASYLTNALKLTYNQKILQVGPLCSEPSYINGEFRRNFILVSPSNVDASGPQSPIRARADALPIANNSIDTLILPHLLEFEADPRSVLDEAERVLKPGGALHILGLNPWSIARFTQSYPIRSNAQHRLIGCQRLIDWLNLLRFDAEFCAGLACTKAETIYIPTTLFRRSMAHLASTYAIRAIKRTRTLIPIKPSWISTPTLATERVLESPLLSKRP